MSPSELYQHLELLPYQSAFAANESRFKIGLWARQTGKDHTASAEAVIDCLCHPGSTWAIVAASERQALETLAKARDWAEILKFRVADYLEAPANLPLVKARATTTEIHWSNGSRLIALPANPATVRGFSASLILTEFAFHEDADAMWKATLPYITNSMRGGKKLRIISTPNGLNNKFAKLWFDGPGEMPPLAGQPALGGTSSTSPTPFDNPAGANPASSSLYYKSRITIHDAIQGGLAINADELRAGLNDEEAWQQEYLCEFIDSSTIMFPYDLIAPCESEQATETSMETTSPASPSSGPLYAGLDFGRHHHLTVCWILERLPNRPSMPDEKCSINNAQWIFVTREVLCLKNTSTPDQLQILLPRLKRCRKICLDYTGAGIGLGDYLAKEFGGTSSRESHFPQNHGKLDLCSFTPALKAELFPRLRAAFEQRSLRIPISRDIREDLHAIQRAVTQSGQISYRAPQTAGGHGDRTTALALALRAATSAPPSGGATTVFVPGRSADLRWAMRRPIISRRFRLGPGLRGGYRF